ncbi:MFS transporter [Simiduia litorea]
MRASLFINYFVFAMLLNSVGTVILQVQNSLGVQASDAAILEAYKDISIALTSFIVASFLVRVGYRRCMMIALTAMTIVCALVPSVPTFLMTKLLFLATGVSFALVKISVFGSLGLLAKDQRDHVSTMNFLEAFFMLGVMAGYFVFSAFVDARQPESLNWLNVYYLLAGLNAIALVLLLIAKLDEASLQLDKAPGFVQEFTSMVQLSIQPLVIVFIVSVFLYVLVEQSIMSWLPSFNSQVLHLSSALSIEMASILAASTALGRLLAGFVLRRMSWYYLLNATLLVAILLVLVALPLAAGVSGEVIYTWADAPLAAFVFPLIGLCLAPVYPAINSVVLSALPARQHAPMAGLIVVFSALGGTLGSLITGNIFQVFGGTTAFYSAIVPIGAILVALYLLRRFVARQTESVSSAMSQ